MSILTQRDINREIVLIRTFLQLQLNFLLGIGHLFLGWIGGFKDISTKLMYHQRGRFSQSFINVSMAVLAFLAIVFSSKIEELIINRNNKNSGGSNYLIMAADGIGGANTLVSDLPKGEITQYRVEDGDTVASIAQKFGVSVDTIVWENKLKSVNSIKPKQILRILPVLGAKHTVKRGETIYSIAKAYQVDPQNIIDYPFNTFSDDETFALTAGQDLMIPDGVEPKEASLDPQRNIAKTVAAIPGVVGEGSFMWPTSGSVSQKYYWYHQAVDIASRSAPNIVASQGGSVISAGWNAGGYGNFVVVDHGNGYKTLYAHMVANSVVVSPGQKVKQGQKLGVLGNTGRSTGPHLHFEIIGPSGKVNPLTVLK